MPIILSIHRFSSKVSQFFGYFAALLLITMILTVFTDVMMRYLFNAGSIAMQEIEWHCFAAMFLLGTAYTLKEDAHVRVDIFYDRFSKTERAYVNIIGILFLLVPFSAVIILGSLDFVSYSFVLNEKSSDPGGLNARYILKSIIPLSYILLLIQGIGSICHNIITLQQTETQKPKDFKSC